MRKQPSPLFAVAIAVGILVAAPAAAQHLRFERAIDVTPGATLDVSTIRGKVAVRSDDGRQIRIDGTVTVRAGVGGLTVPSNALELAQRVADHPRIDVADNVVRLRPPIDADELRAVTVSYEVRVPRDTRLDLSISSRSVSIANDKGVAMDVASGKGTNLLISGSRTSRRYVFRVTGKQAEGKP